jgi:hypothetical protein
MAREWDYARLQRYLTEQTEESLQLEYKAGEALHKNNGQAKEIAKDISAMANSAGGLIIYGIGEHIDRELRHLPEAFRPVDRRECSKERLEQIISSNIQPRLSGIKIFPISLPSGPNDVAYVVSIPQSDTVHQVIATKRYYKRFNFEAVPMDDYEVRDVLSRGTAPILEPRIGHLQYEKLNGSVVWAVPIFVKNKSLVVGKDTAVTVECLDARAENHIQLERFSIKTQPKPTPYQMYIASFPEAIHRGLNKYFGTLRITMPAPQSLTLKLQVFSNGMRAKWWLVKLNFGQTSATIQVLDEDYLY